MIYQSSSSARTKAFAKKMAIAVIASAQQGARQSSKRRTRLLRFARNDKGALVLALSGELGSGKTTFTQGFLRALGVRGPITSPTFILMRRHPLPHSPFSKGSTSKRGGISFFANAIHIDAYRLKNQNALAALGFKELLRDPKNIIIIEWADRVKRMLPKKVLRITFEHAVHGRTLKVK